MDPSILGPFLASPPTSLSDRLPPAPHSGEPKETTKLHENRAGGGLDHRDLPLALLSGCGGRASLAAPSTDCPGAEGALPGAPAAGGGGARLPVLRGAGPRAPGDAGARSPGRRAERGPAAPLLRQRPDLVRLRGPPANPPHP